MLEAFKKEIQNRLDMENENLSNIQQKIRDIEIFCDITPTDFNDIDQHDDEINLNKFLDISENKK